MSKKKSAVLARQKPRRGRKQTRKWLKRSVTGLALAGLVSIGFIAYNRLWPHVGSPHSRLAPGIAWSVVVRPEGTETLSSENRRNMIALVAKGLNAGDQDELGRLARALQKTFALESVHLLKTTPHQVVINVRPRHAALRIEADKMRYLSPSGVVFGGDGDAEPRGELPLLRGALAEGRHDMAEDHTLELSDGEKIIVDEALALTAQLGKAGFGLNAIEFKRYRGFFVHLTKENTDVSLGRAPFDEKIQRLQMLLSDLAKKGSQASRIELDYEGKAFIKERKI